MENQKLEILSFVQAEQSKGRVLCEILKTMRVSRSSYYRWLKASGSSKEEAAKTRTTAKTLTNQEKAKVDEVKAQHPELRHRQVQGHLQLDGIYLSATSVYKRLKEQGLVEPYARRAAPWKEPLYEVYRANTMWGTDWTKMRIGGVRWYLITVIDFFSRMIVHWDIVPTVNAGNIKEAYKMGLANFNIPLDWHLKPELRADQGSPNTSKVTKDFFKDIQAELSFARVARPTDNAITERFYRTIKQEEIYIVGDYQDIVTAKEVIGQYIKWYNESRPHQTLWNYTPKMVHEMNNKTELKNQLKQLKVKTWTQRKEYWKENKLKI